MHKPTFSYIDDQGIHHTVVDVSKDRTWYDVKAVESAYRDGKLTGTINHRDKTFQQLKDECKFKVMSK